MPDKTGWSWIDEITEHTVQNYGGRKIALWGKYNISEEISERLSNGHQIDEIIYIDSDRCKQNGVTVFDPTYIQYKSDNIYVVVPIAYYPSVSRTLCSYGYVKEKDYYYFCDCVRKETSDYYEDAHGNFIYGNRKGLHFAFSGYNSIIKIGENVNFVNCKLYLHDNNFVEFGANVKLDASNVIMDNHAKIYMGGEADIKDASIRMRKNAEIHIGESTRMNQIQILLCNGALACTGNHNDWARGEICLVDDSRLMVGNDFTTGGGYNVHLPANTEIRIGDDCMFSWDITLISNDAHAIFDRKTGKKINDAFEKKMEIRIGNHVWIGLKTTILYNSIIGNGSIIGANSLIKGRVPDNCICAGNPARVIRENIAWCRDEMAENYYDFQYEKS